MSTEQEKLGYFRQVMDIAEHHKATEVCVHECECGAYSFEFWRFDRGINDLAPVTIHSENVPAFVKPTSTTKLFNCNRCVNHWGLDLD